MSDIRQEGYYWVRFDWSARRSRGRMNRRRKCHFCAKRIGIMTIERGYIRERIGICPSCFLAAVRRYRHYTLNRNAQKDAADPRQMILL